MTSLWLYCSLIFFVIANLVLIDLFLRLRDDIVNVSLFDDSDINSFLKTIIKYLSIDQAL